MEPSVSKSEFQIEAHLSNGNHIKVTGPLCPSWLPFIHCIVQGNASGTVETAAALAGPHRNADSTLDVQRDQSPPKNSIQDEPQSGSQQGDVSPPLDHATEAEERQPASAPLQMTNAPAVVSSQQTELGYGTVQTPLSVMSASPPAASGSVQVEHRQADPEHDTLSPARRSLSQSIRGVMRSRSKCSTQYSIQSARMLVISRHHAQCSRCDRLNKECVAPQYGPRAWKCRECAHALSYCDSGEAWLKPAYLSHYADCLNSDLTLEEADLAVYGSLPGLLGGSLDRQKEYSWLRTDSIAPVTASSTDVPNAGAASTPI